ncbi:MAG: glucose-6-phosphate isomerase [Chloroflexi bacterium]|nr:glucose-6-phosphate isomerase [Chloroflexota bacterium]
MTKINMTTHLGRYQFEVDSALTDLHNKKIIARIENHDHTVWSDEPTEIINRLGWLHSTETMAAEVTRMQSFSQSLIEQNYTDVLLLGMGGSSLAPEVIYKTFGGDSSGLTLSVLDSTDPGAVLTYAQKLNFNNTLFIVATKSGGTVETLSFFKYFYRLVSLKLGTEVAGDHFAAITDPGSRLMELAERYQFRATFINDPNIGGRYSALSFFGLLPAALIGVDITKLMKRAHLIRTQNVLSAQLGVILGVLAKAGRDKVTFVTSASIASFGEWVEQLIAESTGKSGLGILPVVGESLGVPDNYDTDRLFVYLQLGDDNAHQSKLHALAQAGHPVITIYLNDKYDLGAQFFLWEMATAVASHILGITPFDQPNVESAKILAREMVTRYQENGTLPKGETTLLTPESLHNFLSQYQPGDYIALQAFIQPTQQIQSILQTLRLALRDRYKMATTLGFGPRFLHSTGQLHKGDAGNGLFIQFISDAPQDAAIPDQAESVDSSISFHTLISAQALGDAQALRTANRRLISFDLGSDTYGALNTLLT